jgi:hypothetical protein
MKAIMWLGIGVGLAGLAIALVGAIADNGVAVGLGVLLWLPGGIVGAAGYLAICQKKMDEARKQRDTWLGQWDRLLEGMTESEVRSTIGAPTKIEPLIAMTGETAVQWTYGSWPSKGIVRFVKGRLVGLQRPR